MFKTYTLLHKTVNGCAIVGNTTGRVLAPTYTEYQLLRVTYPFVKATLLPYKQRYLQLDNRDEEQHPPLGTVRDVKLVTYIHNQDPHLIVRAGFDQVEQRWYVCANVEIARLLNSQRVLQDR